MTRIVHMTDTQALASVRAHFSEYVDRVETEHERIVVTKNGRPAAVLISPDDLAAIEDTLALLSDPDAVAQIRGAQAEVRSGDMVSADDLRLRFPHP